MAMKEIIEVTNDCIRQIYNNGNLDKGLLANLRNSNNINDKYAVKIWPLIFQSIKDNEHIKLSSNGEPTKDEIAIYTALKSYAIFQQATDEQVFGMSFGKEKTADSLFGALARLRNQMMNDETGRSSLDKRVDTTLAMTNLPSIINSVIHLERILKGSKINVKIDFADLAYDIYRIDQDRSQARKVALKWGQIYYSYTNALLKEKNND